jgi:serine/threonine-protein kinase
VAIKVLREELAAAVGAQRFLEEIRVTASLQHPHILPLFDSGSADGLLWYVMPLVEGETLRARLAREGKLPVDSAVQLVWEIADALDYAHRQGVVHRDVKPENVLVHDGHALVADFGIALALESAGGERLTRTGILIGTPQYMAPEQAAGERDIDGRADVYALGAVLHEMLVGEPPIASALGAASPRDMLLAERHDSGRELPPSLVTRRADVPHFVDAAVRRALSKLPDDRFPTAAAFAAAVMVPMPGAGRASAPGRDVPRESGHDAWDEGRAGRSRGRVISARAAVYMALVTMVLGVVGGLALARSSLFAPWSDPPLESIGRWVDGIGVGSAVGDGSALTLLDREGREERTIPATHPMNPRFSPDGRRLAYGAYEGRESSDIWVVDLDEKKTKRLTDDDDDSNDPQWSGDGSTITFSVNAPDGKDLRQQRIEGREVRMLPSRPGMQFASDWLRDGSALLVTDKAGANRDDILVQPTDGSPARPYLATRANENAARGSPDGKWVAYTSNVSGSDEVYIDSYAKPGQPRRISPNGGVHPVWRGDGRELYYWQHGSLVAVELGEPAEWGMPTVQSRRVLFRASYPGGWNTMYDVSPDGKLFAIVQNR